MSLRKSFVNHPETVIREIKPNFLEQIFFQTTYDNYFWRTSRVVFKTPSNI